MIQTCNKRLGSVVLLSCNCLFKVACLFGLCLELRDGGNFVE